MTGKFKGDTLKGRVRSDYKGGGVLGRFYSMQLCNNYKCLLLVIR